MPCSVEGQPMMLPADIVKALREAAEECEKSERDPRTGVSTWPKETTVEWKAADLLEERFAEICRYEELLESVFKAMDQYEKSKSAFRVKVKVKTK